MKVLLINGSPHQNGCVARALREVSETLETDGIETETIWIGTKSLHGCIACNYCEEHGKCVFDDDPVNEIAAKFREADGLILGAAVHYGSANGALSAIMDRVFYSTEGKNGFDKTMKVGAAVVSCRRGGNTAAFDELNKYFTISSMPVVSSQYWNMVHGFTAADVEKDLEGLQTMRTLAHNMAFLIKAIRVQKESEGLPPKEERSEFTSFPDGK